MDITEYCDKVASELDGWKAKVDEVVFRLDKISTGEKAAVVPQVNELHMIVEELGDRIGKLRSQCPIAFESASDTYEPGYAHGQKQWQGTWENVSPGEIGG